MRYVFEPGHTEAGFRARHMMVTWVSGLFKDIHGEITFDVDRPLEASFEGRIDARKIWTGEPDRDEHLRSADFFDVDSHPWITFAGRLRERIGDTHFRAESELSIRGQTLTVPLDVAYLGAWRTPFWQGDENKGELRRIGFEGRTRINRQDFGVAWQDELPDGGVVASDEIRITLNVEAIDERDLRETGAIAYYEEEDSG